MDQRIEIAIDLSPEDTHRCSPFLHKNRNAFRLAVIALHLATKYTRAARPRVLPSQATPNPYHKSSGMSGPRVGAMPHAVRGERDAPTRVRSCVYRDGAKS